MNYVVLDFEWSAVYSKKLRKFVNEIIEFGAVKLDENLNETDEFSMLVTPHIGKKLNPHVKELTHLSMDELKNANTDFASALKKFADFADGSVIATWGSTDITVLLENINCFAPKFPMDFFRFYCNAQLYCEKTLGVFDRAKQLALRGCCEALDIEYDEGIHHRALEDARVTAKCFASLYDSEKIKGFVTPINDEFFSRLAFRTHYVVSEKLHSEQVGGIDFRCPRCGGKIVQKSDWIVKNHSFRADFFCNKCSRKLIATVRYKAHYDGVSVKHRVVDADEKAPAAQINTD